MLKTFLKDYKMIPKSMKYSFVIVVILAITLSAFVTSCGIITPSKGYVLKTEERSVLHLDRYKILLTIIKEDKRKDLLEKVLEKKPGYFNQLTDTQLNRLCLRLIEEVNSWLKVVKANAELVKSVQEEDTKE